MIEKRSDEGLRCVICGRTVKELNGNLVCSECSGRDKTAAEGPDGPATLREYANNPSGR